MQYDLAQGRRRPALHLRTTYAPDKPRQAEIAAGAGARPIPAVPVRVLGEARVTRFPGRTEVRPAALAVTDLAPMRLPLDLTLEGYAQGGWVGGRYSTPFADAQARVTREVGQAGLLRARVGASASAGAQKFAERVDVGPIMMLEAGSMDLALEYRVRVAGRASPGNGLAVTLSTGF